jgi:hypothetical protein
MTARPSLLASCIVILASLPGTADDKTPTFNVKTRKMDDAVQVQGDGSKVTFSVKSPSGIGSATIERVEKTWPEAVALKLHLKGLESLVLSSGKVKLSASVSSQEEKPRVRLWKDDKEDEPLDRKSLLWMEVRILGSDGKPAPKLPLKDGWFEMTLPRALLDGKPPSLSVQWIDFYRG